MKVAIIFLITSLKVFAASYIPESAINGKEPVNVVVFFDMGKCQDFHSSQCVEMPPLYNEKYYTLSDEMIDDTTRPINSKNEIEPCLDQSDCESKNLVKTCSDNQEQVYMAKDYSEIYCSKFLRYEQKLSGKKIVVVDDIKKAAYDLDQIAKKNKEERIARGKINRDKCKKALDYIAGANTDSGADEAAIDAMMVSFEDIHKALQSNRPNKAARLIELIADPAYADLKQELLSILK